MAREGTTKPSGKITVRNADVCAKIEHVQSQVRAQRPKDRASKENIALQLLDAACDDPKLVARVFGLRLIARSRQRAA